MVKRSELEPLIREWLKRPDTDRTEDDILSFYGELYQNQQPLLSFHYRGDKYQMLKSILKNHIVR